MSNKRILIIDDDVELCGEVAEMLAGEGYLVESTSDPAQGRRLIDTRKFDIAILDYK